MLLTNGERALLHHDGEDLVQYIGSRPAAS